MLRLDKDRWQALSPLLDQALELDSAGREALLRRRRAPAARAGGCSCAPAERARPVGGIRLSRDLPDAGRCAAADARRLCGGPVHARSAAGDGRHEHGLARPAERRTVRRRRRREAAEPGAARGRRRRALQARGDAARPTDAPAHRAPARRRRHVDRPAVPRARVRRGRTHRPLR